MRIDLFTFDCCGCGRCVRECPARCLKLVHNGMCSFVNINDEKRCTSCGKCEKACHRNAIVIRRE